MFFSNKKIFKFSAFRRRLRRNKACRLSSSSVSRYRNSIDRKYTWFESVRGYWLWKQIYCYDCWSKRCWISPTDNYDKRKCYRQTSQWQYIQRYRFECYYPNEYIDFQNKNIQFPLKSLFFVIFEYRPNHDDDYDISETQEDQGSPSVSERIKNLEKSIEEKLDEETESLATLTAADFDEPKSPVLKPNNAPTAVLDTEV